MSVMNVELVGHYGSDETHCLSAWTSTKREITDEKKERMDKLLNFLAENGHHTPFEKSLLHFVTNVDTATHIQLLKHRIGVSVNAESARYKRMEPKFYVPNDWPDGLQQRLREMAEDAQEDYKEVVEKLIPIVGKKRAKESARYFLTYANVLTLDVTFNWRSFMHFQQLRNDYEAQKEIRDLAESMLTLVRATGDFDLSLKAFGH